MIPRLKSDWWRVAALCAGLAVAGCQNRDTEEVQKYKAYLQEQAETLGFSTQATDVNTQSVKQIDVRYLKAPNHYAALRQDALRRALLSIVNGPDSAGFYRLEGGRYAACPEADAEIQVNCCFIKKNPDYDSYPHHYEIGEIPPVRTFPEPPPPPK